MYSTALLEARAEELRNEGRLAMRGSTVPRQPGRIRARLRRIGSRRR